MLGDVSGGLSCFVINAATLNQKHCQRQFNFYLRFVEEHGSYHPDCKGHLIHKKYTQEARFGLAYTALSSAFCPFEGIDS